MQPEKTMNGTNEHEGRGEKAAEDFLKEKGIIKEGYSKWICRFEDGQEFNIGDLIHEYTDQQTNSLREQLASERALRKELYQATYDWTDHMELWMEERKFRIDNADLDVLKELIRQGQKAIQKSKSLDEL